MRTSTLIFAALSAVLAGQAGAQAPPPQVMRDAATHEDLVLQARKAAQDKMVPTFKPPVGEDRVALTRPKSLLESSDIICFGGTATLVPKGAILHTPKGVASRIGMQDGARFVSWGDFLTANRAWIVATNVSRAQAEGQEVLSEALVKTFEKEARLVVAVFNEGPISVLPVKTPEAPTPAPK